jgi:protein associated with RNAse G/E
VTGQQFTVRSLKYDKSLRRIWTAHLLERSDTGILLEGYFESEVAHPDLGRVAKGTRSVESFPFGRWYNCFAFYQPCGSFRNYYINVSMPPVIGDGVVEYVDLDIDVLAWPDGRVEVLDLDEFEENSRIYDYPLNLIENALRSKDDILRDPYRLVTPLFSSVSLPR